MKYVLLKEIIKQSTERNSTGRDYPVYSVTNSNGFCLPEEYFNKQIHSDELSKYKVCRYGYIAYNPVNLKIGSINENDKCDCIVSPLYEIFKLDNSVMLNKYLIYFLTSRKGLEKIKSVSQGSVRVQCKFANLCRIKVPCPSLEEQKLVVDLLDNLTGQIKRVQTQHALLSELIESRFVEMFAPYTEKQTYRNISICDIGSFKNGMSFAYKDDGYQIKCLGVGDFKENAFINDVQSELYYVSLSEEPSKEYFLKDGDIVFVRSNGNKNLVGRSVLINPGSVPVVCSGFCIRFRKTNNSFLSEYLLYFFKNKTTRKKMAGRGSNIQNLNQKILSSLQIPLVPLEKQQEFVSFVKTIFDSQSDLNKKRVLLNELLLKLKDKYFA